MTSPSANDGVAPANRRKESRRRRFVHVSDLLRPIELSRFAIQHNQPNFAIFLSECEKLAHDGEWRTKEEVIGQLGFVISFFAPHNPFQLPLFVQF